MRHMRFLKILFLLLALASCAVRSGSKNYLAKYQEAIACYEAKKYYEAIELFKEVMPLMKGKKEMISAQFYQAYALFYEKAYKASAHSFEEFYQTYPRVAQAEEALYMQGYALYLNIPDIRLDQTETEQAYEVLRSYLMKYPTGTYHEQAKQYSDILEGKLAQKEFNAAELYYKLGYYQSAVVALNNFLANYSDSIYAEKALYLRVYAQYNFAEKSDPKEKLDNLLLVIEYYYDFLDRYPDSKYAKELEKVYNVVPGKIDKFVK